MAPLLPLGVEFAGNSLIHDSKALRYEEFAGFSAARRKRARLMLLSVLARRHERRWFGYADRVVVTSP